MMGTPPLTPLGGLAWGNQRFPRRPVPQGRANKGRGVRLVRIPRAASSPATPPPIARELDKRSSPEGRIGAAQGEHGAKGGGWLGTRRAPAY